MTTDEEEALLAQVRGDFERANDKEEAWSPTFTVAEMGVVLKRLDQKEAARDMWERMYQRADDESIQLRTILASTVPEQRPETGVMRFDDDWPGLFIRGDDCFVIAQALLAVRKHISREGAPVHHLSIIADLVSDLQSTRMDAGVEPEGTQHALLVEPLTPEASDKAKTVQELLRTVVDWMGNDNPGAPEIIEEAGEWMEAGCPGLTKLPSTLTIDAEGNARDARGDIAIKAGTGRLVPDWKPPEEEE
jgi:hypothetical protein